MKIAYKKIDILWLHSINISNRVYLETVSHVTQGTHLADLAEIESSMSSDGFFIFLTPGGVSERDFEIGRALYLRSLQLQP